MNHDDISRLSAHLDGDLDGAASRDIEAAIATRPDLREELQRLQRVKDWARRFPGREPAEAVWQRVRDEVARSPQAAATTVDPRQGWSFGRIASRIPSIPADWSKRSQRLLVMALAGIALAGMGRSYVLERRTAAMESKVQLRGQAIGQLLADVGWKQTAQDFRGATGQYFTVECSPHGQPAPVWGTDQYTDDSSICTAAVHAGVLTFDDGGSALVEVLPGANSYQGSRRHGVVSREYDRAWPGGFEFVTPETLPGEIPTSVLIDWKRSAEGLRGMVGQEFSFSCAPHGDPGPVWGTGYYTDDSSICSAAVHAGLITREQGGTVVMRIEPGRKRFGGSEQHGIRSNGFLSWPGSFVFLSGEHGMLLADLDNDVISWRTDASDLQLGIGQSQTFRCPPHGEIRIIWGTGVYTDDSSVCTAAVHAGRISGVEGGVVTIQGEPGQNAYQGSTQNGVTSQPYARWRGSFRFVN